MEDIDRITEMHQSYIQSWHPREYFERLVGVEEPLVLVAEQAGRIIEIHGLPSRMGEGSPRKYGCLPSRAHERRR